MAEPPTETKLVAMELASQYNLFEIFAAILESAYGVFELYDPPGHQLDTYGYTAYALTVLFRSLQCLWSINWQLYVNGNTH